MDSLIVTGKTIEEAVEKGLKELGVKESNVVIEVKKAPSQGFLGLLGSKLAEVELTIKKKPLDYIQDFFINLLKTMQLKGEVDGYVKDENYICLDVWGSEMAILIGRRGQTLNSIQYLLNIILHREFETDARVIVDVEGYRSRRKKTLEKLALNLAQKVESTGEDISLEPMTPLERRIIHTTLQSNPKVTTISQGEGSERKVIVKRNR